MMSLHFIIHGNLDKEKTLKDTKYLMGNNQDVDEANSYMGETES